MLCAGNSDHYSDKVLPDSDLILPACGELIIVRCTANERWYRATAIGRDLEHNIKVCCSCRISLFQQADLVCSVCLRLSTQGLAVSNMN